MYTNIYQKGGWTIPLQRKFEQKKRKKKRIILLVAISNTELPPAFSPCTGGMKPGLKGH